MRQFVAFHTTLRSAYLNFIGRLEEQTKALVRHHLDAATSEFAVHLLASAPESDVYGAQHQSLERMQSGVEDPPLHAAQWGEVRAVYAAVPSQRFWIARDSVCSRRYGCHLTVVVLKRSPEFSEDAAASSLFRQSPAASTCLLLSIVCSEVSS